MRYYEVSNQEEFDQFLSELEKYIEEGKTEGIHLELLPNNYVTSKPIDIPSNFTLSGNNSEIKLVTEVEDWKFKGFISAKGKEGETLNNIFIENINVVTEKILGGNSLPKVRGISFNYVADSRIESVKVKGVRSNGIYLENSPNNVISGSMIRSSGGIHLINSSSNVISDNAIRSSGGIFQENSSYNVISGNMLSDSLGGKGIYLYKSTSNAISGNIGKSNGTDGFYFLESTSNAISGNISKSNGTDGFYFLESTSNAISGNISMDNGSYGIYTDNSTSNVIYLNLTSGNKKGSFKIVGEGEEFSEEYNQFLEKAEG